jgi:acid phosphatase class B
MTAWAAVDKDGTECIYADKKPLRGKDKWGPDSWDYLSDEAFYDFVEIPKGSIKKLIGKELSWNDEAVKLG